MVNSLISLCMGLLIATVGVDAIYGAERFAFGQPFLLDGIEFLLVMVGAYGIGEVLTRLRTGFAAEAGAASSGQSRFRTALPSLRKRLAISSLGISPCTNTVRPRLVKMGLSSAAAWFIAL